MAHDPVSMLLPEIKDDPSQLQVFLKAKHSRLLPKKRSNNKIFALRYKKCKETIDLVKTQALQSQSGSDDYQSERNCGTNPQRT